MSEPRPRKTPKTPKTPKTSPARRKGAPPDKGPRRGKAAPPRRQRPRSHAAAPAQAPQAPDGSPTDREMGKQRIQKVLSRYGVASRRAIEEMVAEGRISLNGRRVDRLPCFVDPEIDEIRLDGQTLRLAPDRRKVYYLLNKPRGVVCTQADPAGRHRAVDLVPHPAGRIYCVGRLDKESTGLIILTNDGQLTEYLTHPKHGVMKTYVVDADGSVTGDQIEKLRKGVHIDGKRTQGVWIKVLRRRIKTTSLEIRLTEGRNREIRRMLARLGNKVRRLKRTAIGPLTDHGLKTGNYRVLTPREVARLRTCGRPSPRGA